MTPPPFDEAQLLRAEIAAAAARLIAQDGADYLSAKRKAARQVLGEAQANEQLLPDNAQIENEVRLYHTLFKADTQPARLFQLRTLAAQLMEELQRFNPYLTGAVLNGTAGAHDDIHLQLFADSAKEVEIYLLSVGASNMVFAAGQLVHHSGKAECFVYLQPHHRPGSFHLLSEKAEDIWDCAGSPAVALMHFNLSGMPKIVLLSIFKYQSPRSEERR